MKSNNSIELIPCPLFNKTLRHLQAEYFNLILSHSFIFLGILSQNLFIDVLEK